MKQQTLRRKHRGISLLECLVALAILAIALSASSRSIGVAAGQSGELRDRLLAQWVAEDRLAEHRAMQRQFDTDSAEGEATQAGQRFIWREQYKPLNIAGFFEITVNVSREGESQVIATMTGLHKP